MQIPNLSVTVCAAVFCCGLAAGQADQDTPAQAAAMAALRQKMSQADGSPSQPAAAAPAMAATVTQASETPAQAAAIEGLRQKIQHADGTASQPAPVPVLVNSQGVVSPPDTAFEAAQARVVAEAQAAAKKQALENAEHQSEVAAIQAKAAADADAARQRALADADAQKAAEARATADPEAKKIAAANAMAQKAAADAAVAEAQAQADKAKAAQAAAANAYYPGKELGFKPIQTPALPISADKQAKLDALLVKYQADQISPEEYHKQRAAILAEP